MIAVAVVGILLAIAVPNYQDHMRRAARSAGQAYLSDLAQREELIFQDTRAYSAATAGPPVFPPPMPSDVALRYSAPTFVITPPAPGAPAGYTITLAPLPGGLLATDGSLTINNLGVRQRGGANNW